MNFYKRQCYHSKELIMGWAFEISIDYHIKRELIYEFFKENPEYADGGTFQFSLITFDWDSKPTDENKKYHLIIDRCNTNQLRFYELTVNIL